LQDDRERVPTSNGTLVTEQSNGFKHSTFATFQPLISGSTLLHHDAFPYALTQKNNASIFGIKAEKTYRVGSLKRLTHLTKLLLAERQFVFRIKIQAS
jgi:acyl-[acyl carrier protein]--UDP-N-acetylglucosamine O-acyltransferase